MKPNVNYMGMKRFFNVTLLFAALATGLLSCHKDPTAEEIADRKVMVLYSAGFNSLRNYLQTNIRELTQGFVPAKGTGKDVILIVSKPYDGSFTRETSPVLIQLYKKKNKVVLDTVKTYPVGTILADPATLRTVMSDIGTMYPAKGYGMVFSSHSTGWLPENVYGNASIYSAPAPSAIRPSTIGQENNYQDNVYHSVEIEIEDMAKAFPYHLDYFVLDACFGGCVEIAYALRSVTDYVAFSPAEILSGGFEYTTMAARLLQENSVQGVCEDFKAKYESQSGINKSATISLVKTSALGELAAYCKELFQTYRSQINAIDWESDQVQTFFGGDEAWFFDLEDILVKAGISAEEKTRLEEILAKCVVYKGHTGQYYSSIDGLHQIESFSGMSMYLPTVGNAFIKNYYKTLSWNQNTSLVN